MTSVAPIEAPALPPGARPCADCGHPSIDLPDGRALLGGHCWWPAPGAADACSCRHFAPAEAPERYAVATLVADGQAEVTCHGCAATSTRTFRGVLIVGDLPAVTTACPSCGVVTPAVFLDPEWGARIMRRWEQDRAPRRKR